MPKHNQNNNFDDKDNKNEWFRKTDQWIDCLITYRWVSFAILHS